MHDKHMEAAGNSQPLVQIEHLKQYFPIKTGTFQTTPLKAVDDVSFYINKGETLGLVGESGCGKTTVGRTMLYLNAPTDGKIFFKGEEVTKHNINHFRKQMQMVFQDPYSSLNPRMTVADIVGEPLDVHKLYKSKEERKARIHELLSLVGLNSEHANRYAHEFSGGQRQRIGIARALAVNPEFIICDESVSALDVSIQAQILNMFKELQEQLNLSYLFIAHDILVVNYMSDRVAVMYLGNIVELATSDELYENTLHPYSQALLSAVPIPDPDKEAQKQRQILAGDVPSPINTPKGCPFAGRCPRATDICRQEKPVLELKQGHLVSCHHVEK